MTLHKLLFLFLVSVCLTTLARAEDTTVTANVSSTTTSVDDPIRLTITITGARNANMPGHIDADGLDINYQSKSQRFELSSGFGATMSTVITYLVNPQKPGKFTIPAIELQAGGQTFHTSPIALTVEKGSGGNSARDDDGNDKTTASKIYAELLLPKDTAYVGEIVPVEVRFYFDSTVTFQLNPPGQDPQIDGEGFSKLHFPQARLEQKSVKGRDYRVLIYQTSLVAAKSGDLSVGPASLNFVVSMPQTHRQRSPFDDPFSNAFGNDPFANFFGNQRIEREMTVHTDPATLHVKQLPSPRPAGFAGAVGQFTLKSSAKPVQVKIGDPITYSSTISGRGNFDNVTAPVLSNSDGFRTYPATGKLTPTDDMSVSGDKTFEMAIIPEKKSTALPALNFVYFDPAQEKFITLEAPPIPVQVEGNAIVAATPKPSQGTVAVPSATPKMAVAESDLTPLKTSLGEIRSFDPIWKSRTFWAWQSFPLILLGALAWPKLAAAFAPDTAATRIKKLHAEHANLSSASRSTDPATFFPAAARQLEIDAELTGNPLPNDETVREIFARRDELAYGGGRGGKELSAEQLRRFQSVLSAKSSAK